MDLLSGGVDENLYNDLYENENALTVDDSFFETPVRIASYTCDTSGNNYILECYGNNNSCDVSSSGGSEIECDDYHTYLAPLSSSRERISSNSTCQTYLSSDTQENATFCYIFYGGYHSSGYKETAKARVQDFASNISGSSIDSNKIGECVVYDNYNVVCALK